MTPSSPRRFVPLLQACEEAPTLAKLAQLARESRERLEAVQFLIPAPLRSAVKAGPIDETSWCLLVDNNAAAAKMRQVVPALTAELRRRGTQVNSIRLKVQIAGK
ncbi:MAG TPA: hypothetical protein VMZ74_05465 [Ramlibacter sp.]|nr:hypothetical protein [Ramlibacter sp.]